MGERVGRAWGLWSRPAPPQPHQLSYISAQYCTHTQGDCLKWSCTKSKLTISYTGLLNSILGEAMVKTSVIPSRTR